MTADYISLLAIVAAAVICPIIAQIVPKKIIPEAVLLLIAGAVFGPNMVGTIQDDQTIQFMAKLGLAFQFLIAGYEIDPKLLTGKRGMKGLATWAVTFVLALCAAALLFDPADNFMAFAAVAIAMTSTALGTLIGIMKERRLEGTALGDNIMSYGVWGQLCPVIAIALLLSTRRAYQTLIVLAVLVGICVLVALGTRRIKNRGGKLMQIIEAKGDSSSQLFVRCAVLLLVVLVAAASVFSLDVILGAFAAGFVLRFILPDGHQRTDDKLNAIAYGFFIPIFFVESGMKIDLLSVGAAPTRLVIAVLALVVVRALPAFVAQSLGKGPKLSARNRAAVSAYVTTALSIIVAVSSTAVEAGALTQAGASLMISGAAISVFLMPLLAQVLTEPEQ